MRERDRSMGIASVIRLGEAGGGIVRETNRLPIGIARLGPAVQGIIREGRGLVLPVGGGGQVVIPVVAEGLCPAEGSTRRESRSRVSYSWVVVRPRASCTVRRLPLAS